MTDDTDKHTKRGFGTIRLLPSGNYQARYSMDGELINAPTTFTDRDDAEAWLTDERRKVEATKIGLVKDSMSNSEAISRIWHLLNTCRWNEGLCIAIADMVGFTRNWPDELHSMTTPELEYLVPDYSTFTDEQREAFWDLWRVKQIAQKSRATNAQKEAVWQAIMRLSALTTRFAQSNPRSAAEAHAEVSRRLASCRPTSTPPPTP